MRDLRQRSALLGGGKSLGTAHPRAPRRQPAEHYHGHEYAGIVTAVNSAKYEHLIGRYVLGLKPLEPGFGKVEIRPQPGPLEWVEGTIPTIRGPVHIRVEGKKVTAELPGNMTATIIPPG